MSLFRIRRRVYWDNNATTPVSPSVAKRMDTVLRTCFGNPSSLYRDAQDSAHILSEARATVAAAINASPQEILFTGSATEANNQILKSIAATASAERKTIVASPAEHQSVISTLEYLAAQGTPVVWLSLDGSGRVDLAQAKRSIDHRTALVCAMLVNNETGALHDVAALAAMAHEAGAWMMADCVQALGKVPVDVKSLGLDYAVVSSHKIHGPKGVGALYAKSGAPLLPFVHGGHQEYGLRAGTEAVHSIAGFREACLGVPAMLADAPKVSALRRRFWIELQALCPAAQLNIPLEHAVCNTLSIRFPGTANSVLMGWLDFRGIAVSAGSACNTSENKPSHVLLGLGISEEAARETVRLSFGMGSHFCTTEAEVRYVLKSLAEFFSGKAASLNAIHAHQLDENLLFDPDIYLLDARYGYDRLLLKSLPNAHEISFPFRRNLPNIPKGKRIVVVCQSGFDAPVLAFALRGMGHRNVGYVTTGMLGFRLQQPTLYTRWAGHNVIRSSNSSLQDGT